MTMTTGKFISQLEALIKKLESLVHSLQCSTFHPSQKQYLTLAELGLRLTAGANNLPIQVAALKTRRAEPSFEEGRKLIAQARSEKTDLIITTKLKDRAIFARNITYFFNSQSDSVIDSDATKARKQLTRERCKRICTLSPDGLISWAVAFKPWLWAANLMSKDTFDYVFDHIEPDDYQVWPPDIYHILNGLGTERPLEGSREYHEFLKETEKSKQATNELLATEDDKKGAQRTKHTNKRKRISDGAAPEGEPLCSVQVVDQYASRAGTSPNEATKTPASNQVACDKAEPSLASAKTNTNTYDGDAFIVDIDDARNALSLNEHVGEIWLTNRKHKHNAKDEKNRSFLDEKNRSFLDEKRRSFITLWISEALGEELGQRSKQMVDCASDKEVQPTNNN